MGKTGAAVYRPVCRVLAKQTNGGPAAAECPPSPPVSRHQHPSTHPSTIHPSIYPSIHLSIQLSIHIHPPVPGCLWFRSPVSPAGAMTTNTLPAESYVCSSGPPEACPPPPPGLAAGPASFAVFGKAPPAVQSGPQSKTSDFSLYRR